MSSNKFSGTLKFRIAVSFTLLFILLLTPVFFLFYKVLEKELLMLTDYHLEGTLRQLRFEYLTGSKVTRSEQEISLEAIPPEILPEFFDKYSDFIPLLAFRIPVAPDAFTYTVIGTREGRYYEMHRTSSGNVSSRLLNPAGNIKLLQRAFETRTQHEVYDSVYYRLLSPSGRVLAGTPIRFQNPLPPVIVSSPGNFNYYTIREPNGMFRILRTALFDGNILELGRSLKSQKKHLQNGLYTVMAAALAVLVSGAVAAYLLAARSVAGIRRISSAARMIAGGDFSRRVPAGAEGAEINELSDTFNHMAENTEHLIAELRNVTDNIAHDLRTPLTRIRGIADVTVNGPQELDLYREMAGTVGEECSSMVQMINTMLEITRTEGGREKLDIQTVSLNELLAKACALFQILFEEKNMNCEMILPDEDIPVRCDRVKMQRVISNLLDNAVKFSSSGTMVRVSLKRDASFAEFSVEDHGMGISEADQRKLFKRFFRSDSSRSLPGNGLGLSLVHAIILAHQGTISEKSRIGEGTVFTVRLPLAEEFSQKKNA